MLKRSARGNGTVTRSGANARTTQRRTESFTNVSVSAAAAGSTNYSLVDEIAARAINSGAKVLAVRKADIPGEKSLAAVLRYVV